MKLSTESQNIFGNSGKSETRGKRIIASGGWTPLLPIVHLMLFRVLACALTPFGRTVSQYTVVLYKNTAVLRYIKFSCNSRYIKYSCVTLYKIQLYCIKYNCFV